MKFISTRDTENKYQYTASQAIIKGLAPDGGLFVPDTLPSFNKNKILELCHMDYPARAAYVLSEFLDDYTYEELLEDCLKAYNPDAFPGGAAPLVHVRDNVYVLELWHGPTAAFKDMALQIMPRLLCRALGKNRIKETVLILVATSGDTGKAALEGYKDIPQIKIMVFYPEQGVSKVQKLQMMTQTGNNVCVHAIKGNFDDAQTGVKKIFADESFAKQLKDEHVFLSSANSINWGRLAPQIAYYVSAYCDLLSSGSITYGDPVDVCVPTGNFGNIFAAYLAKASGLPIRKLVCASNENHILTDFFNSGIYDRNRKFHLTMSPSMDILISSNLERLLYFVCKSENTARMMQNLSKDGVYSVDRKTQETIAKDFYASYADEKTCAKTILDYFVNDRYLCDTHTSVALSVADRYLEQSGSTVPIIVDSTASPYKFAKDVLHSLDPHIPVTDPLEALELLEKVTGTKTPYPLSGIKERKVRFEDVIEPDQMQQAVMAFAKG